MEGVDYVRTYLRKRRCSAYIKETAINDKEVILDHTYIVTVSFSSIRYAMD